MYIALWKVVAKLIESGARGIAYDKYRDNEGDTWEITTLEKVSRYKVYEVNGEIIHVEKVRNE